MFDYEGECVDYEVLGEGETLVFLHGWGGDKYSLRTIYDNLASRYRIVTLTFPKELTSPWTVSKYADMVTKLVGNLEINKYTVIGHSFGGRVALELGNLAEKIVLIDSAGIKPRLSIRRKINILRYKLKKSLARCGLISPHRLAHYGSEEYKTLSQVMKQTFVNIVNYDQKHLLSSIQSPTLIVWGDKDADTPLYMAKILNKRLPHSELVVLNGNHFVYLDKADDITRLIDDFVY